jgi:hypothetical protein
MYLEELKNKTSVRVESIQTENQTAELSYTKQGRHHTTVTSCDLREGVNKSSCPTDKVELLYWRDRQTV